MNGKNVGSVEVYYLEEIPKSPEGLFLKEERYLINAVTERVGKVIERKWTEEELQDATEKWVSLTKNINDIIMIIDNKDIIQYMNWTVPPYTPEEIVGKSIYDYIAPEQHEITKKILERVIKEGKSESYEVSSVIPKTGIMWFFTKIIPVKHDGKVVSVIKVVSDITERKRAEEKIKQHSEHLEQLVEEKTRELKEAERMATIGETAGMVGHDLRNPLQAIVNTIYLANMKVQLLPDELVEKGEVKAYLDTVERQIGYMNKIVSDLLDYARHINPEIRETSVHQLIQGTLLTMNMPETIEVSVTIPNNLKLKVDSFLMKRVFINLFKNDVQAMPDGGKLTITASKTDQDALISVEDTGVGIRDVDLPKLFQPLFTTKAKGQGFGLPVCKRIIDAHNGDLMVKSEVEEGSTFTVKIPHSSSLSLRRDGKLPEVNPKK